MQAEPTLAFRNDEYEPPGLEIRVNFGIFAGRDATPAEIDELARLLVPEVGDVSIVSEQRHEIGDGVEASLHQVRIEVAGDHVPDRDAELDDLAQRLVDRAQFWARACIGERHAEVTEF